jgi:hypothetical protein
MMKFLPLLFIAFMYIFGPVFNSIGSWLDCIFITSILLSLYNLLLWKQTLLKYIYPFLVLLPLLVFAVLVSGLTFEIGFGDVLILLLKPVRIIITLIGGFILVLLIQKTYGDEFISKSLDLIFFSIGIHAIIMIYQFFDVGFKDFVYSYTTNGQFISFEYNFRMGGLSGATGGSILSVVQAMGIIMLPFITDNSLLKRIVRIIFVALIIGSILICGRSGILAIIIFLPIAYMSMNSILTLKFLMRIATIIFGFIGLLSILIIYISSLPDDEPLSLALNRTLDTYITYNETGKLQDNTTAQLLDNHLIFPDRISILAYGQPENLVNFGVNRDLNSDIGYIRDLWSFGVLGAFVYISPLIWVLFTVFISLNQNNASKMLIVISMIFFIFHFKESFFYTRMLWSIYSIVIACHYIIESKMKGLRVSMRPEVNQ